MKNTKRAPHFIFGLLALGYPAATAAQPDLALMQNPMLGGMLVSPSTVPAGTMVTVSGWSLLNTGSASAGAFEVVVYLSSDDTISSGDRPIASLPFATLAAPTLGVAQSAEALIPSDVAAGSYRIGIIVDPSNAVSETNEGNNVLNSTRQLQVVPPVNADLTMELSTSAPNFATGDASQKLSNSALPALAPRGTIFVLALKVRNSGPEGTGPFSVGVFLADDAALSMRRRLLGRIEVSSLAANTAAQLGVHSFTLPGTVDPGDYHIGFVADERNQVIETAGGDEANNATSTPIKVLDVTPDDAKVWRVQARIKTGSVSNAGTDDSVFISINDAEDVEFIELPMLMPTSAPGTWMDYPRNDFNGSDDDVYDLQLKNIDTLGDINRLQIGKIGTDGWCIARIELLVNDNVQVFSKDFPGNCDFIDPPNTTPSVVITYDQLRRHANWGSSIEGYPSEIDANGFISMISSAVGDSIFGTKAYWGHFHGDAVELQKMDDTSMRIDLDLAMELDYLPNPDLDVNFDIHVESTCKGELAITVDNVQVDTDFGFGEDDDLLPVVSPVNVLDTVVGLFERKLDAAIEEEMSKQLKAMAQSFPTPPSLRVVVEITEDETVRFVDYVLCD